MTPRASTRTRRTCRSSRRWEPYSASSTISNPRRPWKPILRRQRSTWLEGLLEALPRHDTITVPNGACYIQLPEQWFWAQIEPEQPHEPVDGLFVVEGAHRREFLILVVLGLRADRPGFSQVSLTVRPEDFSLVAEEARTPPFAPVLDGGDTAGLKSLVSEADVLLLAQLGLQVVSGE